MYEIRHLLCWLIYNFISVYFTCFHVTTVAYSRGLSVCNLFRNNFLRIRSFVLFKRDVHVWVHSEHSVLQPSGKWLAHNHIYDMHCHIVHHSGIFIGGCPIYCTTETRVYIMNVVWVIRIPSWGTFNTYRVSTSGSTPVFRCLQYWRMCYFVITINVVKIAVGRSQWPRGLRRRSAVARLLRLWVRMPPGAWMSVVIVVCCQVEVSATSWSLV